MEARRIENIRQECIREKQEREAADRMEKIQKLFEISSLPERFNTRTFATFEQDKYNRHAFETAYHYAENFKDTQDGLIFRGSVGTGKTHLAAAIAIHLLNTQIPVVFGTATKLLGRIRQTYSEYSVTTERDIINSLATVDLLVVDDLGKENPTAWVQQTLYEVINTRYENNKPLIVTTNTKMKALADRMPEVGEAIVSRLLEMCHGVELGGPDRRKL